MNISRYIRPVMIMLVIMAYFSTVQSQNLLIYRNDSTFNAVPLREKSNIEHFTDAQGRPSINVSSIAGQESIAIENIDSCVVRHKDIPTLYFTFPDYPDRETVWTKDYYIDAVLSIDGGGMTDDISDLTLQVKGRGNSTWGITQKKPIRLKFPKKTSICGFNKAKSYVLLANYIDASHMKNMLSLWLARKLDVPFSNHTMPCNLIINGSYQGLYLLTEKVGINSGSVNIDEEEGILFELDDQYDEKYKFYSAPYNLPTMVKDPDFDEMDSEAGGITPEERLKLWEEDFNIALEGIKTGNGFDYFDINSVINYILVNDFSLNNDWSIPRSFFIWKKRLGKDEKYYFGPIWDHDVAYNFIGRTGTFTPLRDIWYPNFCKDLIENEEFKSLYKERVKYLKNEVFPEMLEAVDGYSELIAPHAMLDGVKWPAYWIGLWYIRHNSFKAKVEADLFRSWLIDRMDYMTKQYGIVDDWDDSANQNNNAN